ncbi:MAG TPA: chaperone modulator CbpM [Flavitalea sp.]|nr:chaperone modulator CbpM [Flavitalea sp.]
MKKELFAITTYCSIHGVDQSFIASLSNEGLINITIENQDEFIEEEELQNLELYTRWYHEMGINTEGIDAIRHLVKKLRNMQIEVNSLKNRLRMYEDEIE